jgi:plastocyanin
MNKVLIAVIAVLILAGGGWAVYNHNKSSNSAGNSTGNSQNQASSSGSNSNQPPTSGTIDIKNMMFTPSQITVAKGGTVTWTNNDTTTHTVVDDLSNVGGPASGDIPAGGTYSFTFNKTGSFQYHCRIHPSMRGTIVVK